MSYVTSYLKFQRRTIQDGDIPVSPQEYLSLCVVPDVAAKVIDEMLDQLEHLVHDKVLIKVKVCNHIEYDRMFAYFREQDFRLFRENVERHLRVAQNNIHLFPGWSIEHEGFYISELDEDTEDTKTEEP